MAKPNTSEKPMTLASVDAHQARQDAPGAPKTKKGKKGRPTVWKRWGKQLERAQALLGKIAAAAAVPSPGVPVESESAAVRRARADLGALVSAGFAKQVAALVVLDAEGVPAPVYRTPPKFSVGQTVRITKAALPQYLKSGFFTPAELGDLQVSKVSANGKAFLCASKSGAVQVTSFRHLEPRS